MSDQRLRRLEREVAASPSPEAEAALLRARLRAGTLSLERLELAAYCHPPGAYLGGFAPWIVLGWVNGRECVNKARVSGRAVPAGETHFEWCPGSRRYRHPDERARLAWWVAGLSRWGHTVQVRAAVAAARAALPIEHPCFGGPVHVHDATGGDHYGGDCDLALFAIEGAEKWLEDPTPKNLLAWRNAWFACEWEQAQWLPWVSSADYPQPSGPPTVADQASHIIRAGSLAGDAPVRAAIQSALISWALGSQGPAQKFNQP